MKIRNIFAIVIGLSFTFTLPIYLDYMFRYGNNFFSNGVLVGFIFSGGMIILMGTFILAILIADYKDKEQNDLKGSQ